LPIFDEDLSQLAAPPEGVGQDTFDDVGCDKGSLSHGGIVIVVPRKTIGSQQWVDEGIVVGLTCRVRLTVTENDTAEALRSGNVAVLATPRLIALAEQASCEAVEGRLAPGRTSVATRVQFDHLAPVAVGATVIAEATLVRVEGRRLTFTVSANLSSDALGRLIGAGRLTRVVVDEAAFLAKAGATPCP
jgi:predicted thioesterase